MFPFLGCAVISRAIGSPQLKPQINVMWLLHETFSFMHGDEE